MQNKRLLLNIFILTSVLSCNTASTDERNNTQLDTILLTKPYLDNTDYSRCTVSYTGKPDTIFDGIPAYFMDTFSQAENRFRIVYQSMDSINDAILEKLVSGQWFIIIDFDKFNGAGEITHFLDINNDGYKDIVRDARSFKQVYFFDKSTNNFIDTIGANINDGIFLIDTNQNIYCDIQEFRQMCGQIHSQLYTFVNFTRVNLFDLELYNCTNDKASVVTKLILSKCYDKPKDNYFDSLIKLETTKLQKPINLNKDYEPRFSYFDYAGFWKRNYKRLMGL